MEFLLKRPKPVEEGLNVDLQKADLIEFYCSVEFPSKRNNKSFVNTFQKILKCIIKRIEKGFDSQTNEGYLKEHLLFESINYLCDVNYKVSENSVTEFFRTIQDINFDPFRWNEFYILRDDNSLTVIDLSNTENGCPKLICNFKTDDYYIIKSVTEDNFETSSKTLRYNFFGIEEPECYLCDYDDHCYEDDSYDIKVGINMKTGELVKFVDELVLSTGKDENGSPEMMGIPSFITKYDNLSREVYNIKFANGNMLVIRAGVINEDEDENSSDVDYHYFVVKNNTTLKNITVYFWFISSSVYKDTGEYEDKPKFIDDSMVTTMPDGTEINYLEKYYEIIEKAFEDYNMPEKAKRLIKLLGGQDKITVSDLNELCDDGGYSYLKPYYLTTYMKSIIGKKLHVDKPILALKDSYVEKSSDVNIRKTLETMFTDKVYITYEVVYNLLVSDVISRVSQRIGSADYCREEAFYNHKEAEEQKKALMDRIVPTILHKDDVKDLTIPTGAFYIYPAEKISVDREPQLSIPLSRVVLDKSENSPLINLVNGDFWIYNLDCDKVDINTTPSINIFWSKDRSFL
jgi:hypothetical protein